MIKRRGFFVTGAAGLAAALLKPFAPEHLGQPGIVGKYIPHRITADHVFAGYLEVWDLDTGETIPHVIAIEVDNGRLRRPKFVERPEMVWVSDTQGDIFGFHGKSVPHPTRTVKVIQLDENNNIVMEDMVGTFELNWKDRKIPEHILRMKEVCPPEIWKEICKNEQFDITSLV